MIQPGNLVVEEEEEYNITILFNFSQVEYKALIINFYLNICYIGEISQITISFFNDIQNKLIIII